MKRMAPNKRNQSIIRQMVAEGKSIEAIASRTQVHTKALQRWIEHFQVPEEEGKKEMPPRVRIPKGEATEGKIPG